MIVLGFVYAQLGFHYMSALDQRCRRAPASSRMRNNINWIKKYSCKFKNMHTRFGLDNQG